MDVSRSEFVFCRDTLPPDDNKLILVKIPIPDLNRFLYWWIQGWTLREHIEYSDFWLDCEWKDIEKGV